MSEKSLANWIEKYKAIPGTPKRYTRNPCRLCGWSEGQAIHQNPNLIGSGPYHNYEPPPPAEGD